MNNSSDVTTLSSVDIENKSLLDTVYNLQTINTIISSVAGLILHVYITFTILKKRLLHDKYIMLTYFRSYNDILFLISVLILCEKKSVRLGDDIAYASYYASWPSYLQQIVVTTRKLTQIIQTLLVYMCVIHRFLIFVRPGYMKPAYFMFTVIATLLCTIVMTMKDPTGAIELKLYFILVFCLVICSATVHVALEKYFTAHKYSITVCEIQNKTSRFLLWLILLYCTCYAIFPMIGFCAGMILVRANEPFTGISGNFETDARSKQYMLSMEPICTLLGFALHPWLPLGNGILSLWSIYGYFHSMTGRVRRSTQVNVLSETPI